PPSSCAKAFRPARRLWSRRRSRCCTPRSPPRGATRRPGARARAACALPTLFPRPSRRCSRARRAPVVLRSRFAVFPRPQEDSVVKEPVTDLVVAGKYCLEGQLAAGGMGSVWVARHIDLDVPVAIKFMGIECASSEEGRVRFEREAKAAAFLQSPHVVNVQDYGIDEGLPYIVMELLNG